MRYNLDKILFLDIETVPLTYRYSELDSDTKDLWDRKWLGKKEQDAAELYEKAGVYAEFAKVICVGLGYYNSGKLRVKSIVSSSEKDVLKQLAALLAMHFSTSSHQLCAHNGKEFDFPFLCRRFLINEIPLPEILQLQGKKPWEVNHIDTMELWKFGDHKSYTSLNLLAHIFGIPSPKEDIDGSMVAKVFWEENDLERIAKYCTKDVITLARVFNRFAGAGPLPDEDIIFT